MPQIHDNCMRSMEILFLMMAFLLGGLMDMEAEAISVTGESGKDIVITCPHSNAYSNVKYFCNRACTYDDILISSRKNKTDSTKKYGIKDEGNTFYVTILFLEKEDSGTYWCGVERNGYDTYNTVVLTVTQATPVRDIQQPTASSFSKKLIYTGAGLGATLLTLAIILLILFRQRKRQISRSSGKEDDTNYAASSKSSQKHGAQTVTTISSATASEGQDTNYKTDSIFPSSAVQHQGTSRDSSIYSTVTHSSECHIQADGLLYSTVSFKNHTDRSAVTPASDNVTYSELNHTSCQ